MSVAREVVEHRERDMGDGNPESRRAVLRKPGYEVERAPAGERDAVARLRARVRKAARAARPAQLDDPPRAVTVGQLGREMHDSPVIGPDRGRDRRRRVDDQQVTRCHERGQVPELGVDELAGGAERHQHPYLVARDPARLGRRLGDQLVGKLEA
jgi:hypothetical protein